MLKELKKPKTKRRKKSPNRFIRLRRKELVNVLLDRVTLSKSVKPVKKILSNKSILIDTKTLNAYTPMSRNGLNIFEPSLVQILHGKEPAH